MVVERAQAAGGRGFSNRQVALCGFCGHGFDLTYWGGTNRLGQFDAPMMRA
jgi:hypothetical protein